MRSHSKSLCSSMLLVSLLTMILYSCGSSRRINKSDITPIGNYYSATFNNQSYSPEGKHYIPKGSWPDLSILGYFEILNANADKVSISFDSIGQIVLRSYSDSLLTKTQSFKGRFTRQGYYEIFLRKEKVEIPPLIPILYSRRDIYRLRIARSKNNDLIIQLKFIRDGNLLIFGAGSSDKILSYFHPFNTLHN
jgi:hypothetical protein